MRNERCCGIRWPRWPTAARKPSAMRRRSSSRSGCPRRRARPSQILAHIGDLMAWGLSMADGTKQWRDATPLAVDRRGETFLQPHSTKFDSVSRVGRAAQIDGREAVPGPDRRCAPARRTTDDAAPRAREHRSARELLQSGHRRGAGRAGSGEGARGILMRTRNG